MNIESASITMLPIASIVNNDGQIAGVPKNPRMITEERFTKLKERMKKDNLLGIFPLKVYLRGSQYVALGGNQRLRAAKALKMKEAACIIVPEDTDTDTLKEIVILENTHDGANDWDMLANEWDEVQLEDWGVDVPKWETGPQELDAETEEKPYVAKVTFKNADDCKAFVNDRRNEIEISYNCIISISGGGL